MLQCFSYKSVLLILTQQHILCKYIIDVYLLKDLLGQGGEHTFEAYPFVYLQSDVLTAFYTLI